MREIMSKKIFSELLLSLHILLYISCVKHFVPGLTLGLILMIGITSGIMPHDNVTFLIIFFIEFLMYTYPSCIFKVIPYSSLSLLVKN